PLRRGLCLCGLLGLELLVLTWHFTAQGLIGATPSWTWWVGSVGRTGLSIGLVGGAPFLVIVHPRLPGLWQAMRTPARRHRWPLWLTGHGLAFGGFTLLSARLLSA